MKNGFGIETAGIGSSVWGDLAAEHFDGHTEFDRLSHEQRLAWLSEMAMFIQCAREWRNGGEPACHVEA
ncbi:MAG: hypothetical protein JO069_18480 [Verrucomicrobia bacterium]|nr:hypothetical protein [Verrucomicrobiota bacterium]